ncbi:hypothetical protein HAX54_032588 [Datura stramonium]|uniref:Uncharacterized protein n=1 Tax=Datura stramonium TaxID=4076 RepID=A0ABS8VAZ3_DATST|nr:hypothetical protein [Datura stramonium]
MVSPILTNSRRLEIQGKNLQTHSIGRCENKRPVLCARRFHKAKSKDQEAAATTASPPQSDEGSEEAEFDGESPPADNAEEGNDDAEESGDDDTEAEESGDKESAAERSNEQVGDSEPANTPEARSKRWFL